MISNSSAPILRTTGTQKHIRLDVTQNSGLERFEQVCEPESKLPQLKSCTYPSLRVYKTIKVQNLVLTFVSKLKQTISLRRVPEYYVKKKSAGYAEECFSNITVPSIQYPYNVLLEIVSAFLTILLIVQYQFVYVFPELQANRLLTCTQYVCLISFFVEMVFKSSTQFITTRGKPVTRLSHTLRSYIQGKQFKMDTVVWLCLAIQLCVPIPQVRILRLSIAPKVLQVRQKLLQVQNMVCISHKSQLWWRLVTILLNNFLIMHALALILNLMAGLDAGNNWLVHLGIQGSEWKTRYVYGCYWSVNIMLTVGFGDLSASNETEALCLIFIESVSCLMLAYNINRIGQVLQNMGARELEKNQHLRTFTKVCRQSNFSSPILESSIRQSIDKQFEIKQNYDVEQEQQTLDIVPLDLKDLLFRKMHLKLFRDGKTVFLKMLRHQTLQSLATKLTKKIVYPDEIVALRGQGPASLRVLKQGKLILALMRNRQGVCSAQPIHEISSDEGLKMISLEQCIKHRLEPANIVSAAYTTFYELQSNNLQQVIRQSNSNDFEIYSMTRDREKGIQLREESLKCGECKIQDHSRFECPRLHYIPIKLLTVQRKRKLQVQPRGNDRRERKRNIEILRNNVHRELEKRQKLRIKEIIKSAAKSNPKGDELSLDKVHNWNVYFRKFNIEFNKSSHIVSMRAFCVP